MKRKIAMQVIKSWIAENEPHGVLKLAVASGVSLSTLDKVLRHQYKSQMTISTMNAISMALGKSLDEVFPKK